MSPFAELHRQVLLLCTALLLAGLVSSACTRLGFSQQNLALDSRTGDGAPGDAADAAGDLLLHDRAVFDLSSFKELATFSRSVDAQMNIYGAGHATPPAPAGGGAGQLPLAITLPAGVDRVVQLTKVSGSISYFQVDPPMSADGEPEVGIAAAPSWGGLSGFVTKDRAPGLTAVFLDGAEPKDPPPPALNVGDGTFAVLSPALRQIFWMGDGLTGTGSGALQLFHVPAGATRLFLGIVDRLNSGSLPGYYQDNKGSFQLDGKVLGR